MGKSTYPISYEAERSVLTAMLTDSEALVEVLSLIHPDDLTHPDHKAIFHIAGDLFHQGEPVDMVTVSVAYRAKIGKSSPIVADLFKDGTFNGSYTSHIKVVKDLARRRWAVKAIQDATEKLNGVDDAEEVISELTTTLLADPGSIAKRPVRLDKVILLTQKRIELALEKGSTVTGIPTGYKQFDDIMGGIQPGELVVIGARPSLGKSALLAGICLGAAKQGHAALIVNAEMELVEVGTRLLAQASGIPNTNLRRGDIYEGEHEKIVAAASKLSPLPVWIYDDVRWDVIKMQIRSLKRQRPDLAIVAIDYVQRIKAEKEKGDLRYEVLGRIAREAKDLARDLHLGVVVAAQLSRSVERESKEPQLSDFRECGDLEQEADVASFLHCPKPKEDPDSIYWIIKKNRNGPLAKLHFRFVGDDVAFYDWEDSPWK